MLKHKSFRDSITQHSDNVLPKKVECSPGSLWLKYFKTQLNVLRKLHNVLKCNSHACAFNTLKNKFNFIHLLLVI